MIFFAGSLNLFRESRGTVWIHEGSVWRATWMSLPAKKGQRSRRDWLDAALIAVARKGVNGLKVQELAAELGATTGSLYWHFEDRRALELALLEHWAEESTEQIARQIENTNGSPEDRLLQLLLLVEKNQPTMRDIAIRSFATHDEAAAEVVERVDERRAAVVSRLFREMGFRGTEVSMRTQLCLCYEACQHFVAPGLSARKRRQMLRARHRLYCSQND